jgi:putative transposase
MVELLRIFSQGEVIMSRAIRRNMKDWGEIVNTQRESGLSAKKYCEENGIGLASFYKWRGRIQQEGSVVDGCPLPPGFVEMGSMNSSRLASADSNWRVSLDLGDIRLTIERG